MRYDTPGLRRSLSAALLIAVGCILLEPAARGVEIAASAVDAGNLRHSSACRIGNYLPGGGADMGSGTLVDVTSDGSRGLVLTCAHLFASGVGNIVVEFADGSKHGGLLIAVDRAADLAAVEIANPLVAPAAVGVRDDVGGVLAACGFGPVGAYRCVSGTAIGCSQAAGRVDLRMAAAVRSGDSGGGVFDERGRLVAVVWGESGGVTYASTGRPLARFLDRVLGGRTRGSGGAAGAAGRVAACPDGRCPLVGAGRVPAAPAGRSPAASGDLDTRPVRGCECGEEMAAIRARLEAMQHGGATPLPAESPPASTAGGSSLGSTMRRAATAAAAALSVGGPLGAAIVAGATVGVWFLGRRKRVGSRVTSGELRKKPCDESLATCDSQLAAHQEATAAAAHTFPADNDADVRIETHSPIERDDREARQLLRLSQLEGRDPLQDAVAGRLALDRLDAIADGDGDASRAAWAGELARELRERFNEVAPTKFVVSH